jgi:hypothetical protein
MSVRRKTIPVFDDHLNPMAEMNTDAGRADFVLNGALANHRNVLSENTGQILAVRISASVA